MTRFARDGETRHDTKFRDSRTEKERCQSERTGTHANSDRKHVGSTWAFKTSWHMGGGHSHGVMLII